MKKLIVTILMTVFLSMTWAKDNIKLMVPVPVGGTWDNIARIMAKSMEQQTGSKVIIENRAGAMSQIGIRDFVASADLNGMSMLIAIPAVFSIDFEGSNQIVPIAYIGSVPESLITKTASKFNQIKDVVVTQSYTTLSCVGDGGLSRFLTVAAKNPNLMCIPYKGATQGITDVMGGHIDIATTGLAAAKAIRESGKVKILGYTGYRRSHLAPDVATLAEQGIDLPSSLKFWVFVHKDTAPNKIAELQKIIATTIATDEFKSATHDLGLDIEPYRGTAAEYFYYNKTFVQDMYKK
jgi:tripartite-type tricarboxylate transporter receptor subunit TctC